MNAVLMVARNNLSLTKLAVKSILEQDIAPTLIVVNNASSDGTCAWLSTKRVATITFTGQKSLGSCWNAGLFRFWNAGAEKVLVVNNDIEILPTMLRRLRDANLAFVTGVSVASKDRMVPDMWSTISPHPDFSCFMMREDVFYKVGPFDEDYYPAYYEDNAYHVRMHRAGIKAVSVDLPFYHAVSQTLKNASPQEQAIIRRGADRNKLLFQSRYGCLPGTPAYEELFNLPAVDRQPLMDVHEVP